MMKNLKNYFNYFSKTLDSHFINAEAFNTKAAGSSKYIGVNQNVLCMQNIYWVLKAY